METDQPAVFKAVSEILVEILDTDPAQIVPEAYLMRDLGAESIDLMELAVTLNERFGIEVNEELIFLKPLRPVIEQAHGTQAIPAVAVAEKFTFLDQQRISEILEDLTYGPVLKVRDLVAYICQLRVKGPAHAH